jgi:hypothetical protein
MAMVCPKCSSTYEQRLQCPMCNTRLLYLDPRRMRDRPVTSSSRWQQTPWGRILIGVLLAQGLFYGLRHLLTAVLLAVEGEERLQVLWGGANGLLLLQCVRLVSVGFGAVLAGGGQRNGLMLGGMVGVWNGVFSVLFLTGPAQALTTIAVLGQPVVQAACGALCGWLGSTYWKPIPIAPLHVPVVKRKRGLIRSNLHVLRGPVAWFRVAAGVLLAVAGTVTATFLFDMVLDASQGALGTTDGLQDQLITMEIKALSLFLGGALAGSSTRNGLKQGLLVGLLTCVILIGIEMHFVAKWAQVALLTLLSAFPLTLVGGWFGSQLLPPVLKVRRARSLRSASL